ncbi:MAG: hypothetical protein QOJ03_1662, partial [Frankiaceae bacterium]|nr:hypothetical protein [Frankiaceae bacterium]
MPPELGWLCGDLTERLEWLCEQVPSSDTLVALEAMEHEPMAPKQRMLYAAAWDRQRSATAARAMAAQVKATAPAAHGPYANQELIDGELAGVLRRTDGAMAHQLSVARWLDEALPLTFKLCDAGDITLEHARAIEQITSCLTVDQAQLVDASVADRATTMTVSAFRRVVRQAVAALDVDGQRQERAKRTAGVSLYPEADGMCLLAIRMPATDGVAAISALNIDADRLKTDDDDRTHGMRQVDAFLDAVFATDGAGKGTGKVRARRRTEVQVTIDWASLVGLRENPGELAGYGPVAAQYVRDMLAQDGTTLRRLVYEPITGVLLDYGKTCYKPGAHLHGLVAARDVTCRYPGCCRNAVYCHDEHCIPFDAGGTTSCANCGLMCPKHHNRKTHLGYRYRRVDPVTG